MRQKCTGRAKPFRRKFHSARCNRPEHPCGVKYGGYSPTSLALQVGSKQMSPDELTQVSDSGE
ncbi:hypothetical protein CV016_12930 [Yersinia kristensenii]|uniref:Uncharacterized protein n=1 Tax=Yersinia kristensenii TaxID=28152 RepID=A0AB73NQY6_YERKR|nr:hypothetical protein CBW52_00065 [Yersinia kristensenii]PJE83268.1 hypothetical protein CU276_13730 [Yersinia kristensenii]PJG62338.1 hypothetical protein CV016_12930 [Yersinia kristensenii]